MADDRERARLYEAAIGAAGVYAGFQEAVTTDFLLRAVDRMLFDEGITRPDQAEQPEADHA